MTTYTKETALYDTGKIGDDIDDAATQATNYLTDVSGGGVMVHPSDDSTSGWKISSALEMLKSGVAYIWAGLVNNIATVRVGKETGGHSVIDENGMRVYGNTDGSKQLANIGYGLGTDSGGGTDDAPYYTFGTRSYAVEGQEYDSTKTYKIGDLCLYDDGNGYKTYVCAYDITTPESWDAHHWKYYIGNYSMAEGYFTTASGFASHSEGYATKAIGYYSHAEGFFAKASEVYSHSEGNQAIASGMSSHAEGASTEASGHVSHAEGRYTESSGVASHAQNTGTIAQRESQTAIGEYNIADTTGADGTVRGDYALIIGNGISDSNRSNALTVDWDGDICMALNTTASSGTTDGDLYSKIKALSWQSSVIV